MRGNWKWTSCTDGARVPTWITIRGIEWAVGAEVTTEARDCFMQRKYRGNKSEMADGDVDRDTSPNRSHMATQHRTTNPAARLIHLHPQNTPEDVLEAFCCSGRNEEIPDNQYEIPKQNPRGMAKGNGCP